MALGIRPQRAWWHWKREEEDLPPAAALPRHLDVTGPPARRVAVCDDDLPFIRFVERALAGTGATVHPVTTLDPAEAVRVIADTGCDAALIDLHMYNDDRAGLTIAELLRHDPATRDIRMRIATAAPRDLRRFDTELESLNCPVLPKPFDIDELLLTLGLEQAPRAA